MLFGEFLYPVAISRDTMRAKIQTFLDNHKVPAPVNSEFCGTVNGIQYWCRYFNINPGLILATMILEQPALFGIGNGKITDWTHNACLGVVGQDAPGTSRTDLLGVAQQIYRCPRSYAWSFNATPGHIFGEDSMQPTWPRYKLGRVMQLLDTPGQTHVPLNAQEYALLMYCPHLGRLESMQEIWDQYILNDFNLL